MKVNFSGTGCFGVGIQEHFDLGIKVNVSNTVSNKSMVGFECCEGWKGKVIYKDVPKALERWHASGIEGEIPEVESSKPNTAKFLHLKAREDKRMEELSNAIIRMWVCLAKVNVAGTGDGAVNEDGDGDYEKRLFL
ncbi:hypothetical protein Tco_1575609 [Tanacetum coccineum]